MDTIAISNIDMVSALVDAGYSVGISDAILKIVSETRLLADLVEISRNILSYFHPCKLSLHLSTEQENQLELWIETALRPELAADTYDKLIREYLGAKWCSMSYEILIMVIPQ